MHFWAVLFIMIIRAYSNTWNFYLGTKVKKTPQQPQNTLPSQKLEAQAVHFIKVLALS